MNNLWTYELAWNSSNICNLKCAPLSLPKELMVSVSHEFKKLYKRLRATKYHRTKKIDAAKPFSGTWQTERNGQWEVVTVELWPWPRYMIARNERKMRKGRLFAKILRQDTSLKTIPMSVMHVTNANNGTDLQRLQDRSQWPVGVRSWRVLSAKCRIFSLPHIHSRCRVRMWGTDLPWPKLNCNKPLLVSRLIVITWFYLLQFSWASMPPREQTEKNLGSCESKKLVIIISFN